MRLAVAREGQSYSENGVPLLQWPRGGGIRDVLDVPDDQTAWSARMRAAFDAGRLVEVQAGPSVTYRQLQAEATRLGIKAVGVSRSDLQAAIDNGRR